MAVEGFRAPKATYSPTPPPNMNATKGMNWASNEPLKAIITRMHVATPTNRKKTVPRLVAIACRELA